MSPCRPASGPTARVLRTPRLLQRWAVVAALTLACLLRAAPATAAAAATLRAGTARIDITHPAARTTNDPLFAKALVLSDGQRHVALVTVDAVAIAEIGSFKSDYLANVRRRLARDLPLPPRHLLVNASHCHGIVCDDVEDRTVQVVREAWNRLVPVRAGAGRGREERISENRRLRLADGRHADVRHAYAMPPDDLVAGIGPIDPDIGILRLDRLDGTPLAVVYNFAVHPIQGIPGGRNTADLVGFASRVIEENLGPDTTALFLQGCAGDINPVRYKDVNAPRDAEPLGHRLGLAALRATRPIVTRSEPVLDILADTLALPRADHRERIARLKAEQARLLQSLEGTSLDLKTFLSLAVKYQFATNFPSYHSHAYLRDRALGRDDWQHLDDENRRNLGQYTRNILVMEELTRVQVNLALLEKHQARNVAAASPTIDAELAALRVGDFVLVAFPGELTVEIGLALKQRSPHPHTYVAGYTNGYLYYTPTEDEALNPGCAQEDSECLLAPGWRRLFDARADALLSRF